MEKRRVRLNINGVVCGLITGESEEYMQALADEVGDLMKQVMASSPLVTREAAALTAALSICDDCHKSMDRVKLLEARRDELEVEAELWQEEKVELLKSAVDTQKDAQLAEKAARLSEKASRLESENTRLEEHIQRLLDVEERARSLEDENAALREAAEASRKAAAACQSAAKAPDGPSPREAELAAENRELIGRLTALEERLAQQAAAAPAAPASPAVKRRRGNPLRREPDMEQEGLQSFFETKDE